MSASPHLLILASAGTGKTHRLVHHFLRLLLEGVDPERILATTFTRKAAGEILERVLARLLEAIASSKALAELGALAPGRPVTEASCRALLAKLARRLDRFHVRTLDSFFVHLAQLFALELGLPGGWHIVDASADGELRALAIGRVLGELGREERSELLRALHRESAARSVHAAMLRVVQSGRDAFLESDAEAWRAFEGPEPLGDEALAAVVARLAAIQPPQNKDGSVAKDWRTSLDKVAVSAAGGRWDALLCNTLVEKAVTDAETYARKPIDAETREVLHALASHAAACLLARAADQTRAYRAFLERFEDAYRALKRERGEYSFDDLPLAFAPGAGRALDERELDLWFRVDGRIDHLLLDEFQDTAPLQWRALEPLAAEVLAVAEARSFFCVGDVKQSIYGWRQAEPRLLERLNGRYPVLGEGEPLTRSWRSSIVVLDTVNRVFSRAGELELFADEERPAHRRAAARWQARFQEHTAARDLPGDAVLVRPERVGDEDEGASCRRLAVERVVELARRSPHATIGVLVRSNKMIAPLLHELGERGVRASGEGGNPLVDAEPVQVFLSALHLADHPCDSAAAFHVETSPLARLLAVPESSERGGAVAAEPARSREEASRNLRARLVREGYAAVAASCCAAVDGAPCWSDWEKRRFHQLVELAHALESRATLRPAELAELVRETAVEDPSSARVRVMTIHKAKGLEFDAVVLPELCAPLVRSHHGVLSIRSDPYGAIDRVTVRPRNAVARFSPELAELSAEADARDVEEALCVLYVAMTRAKRRLEMIAAPLSSSGKPSTTKSFASLLGEVLGEKTGEPDAHGVLWRHPGGTDAWDEGLGAAEESEPPAPIVAPRWRASRRARALPTRSPSLAGEARSAAALLARADWAATTHGKLVHRWLERCTWLDGFERDDEPLLALAAPLEHDLGARRDALAFLRRALAQPAIRALLTRPPTGEPRVENERQFSVVLREEDGVERLWTGAIDRLVVELERDRPVAAVVIDYKTDDVPAEHVAARVELHRPQLEAYRRVAAAITGLAPDRIAARLAFLAPGVVADL